MKTRWGATADALHDLPDAAEAGRNARQEADRGPKGLEAIQRLNAIARLGHQLQLGPVPGQQAAQPRATGARHRQSGGSHKAHAGALGTQSRPACHAAGLQPQLGIAVESWHYRRCAGTLQAGCRGRCWWAGGPTPVSRTSAEAAAVGQTRTRIDAAVTLRAGVDAMARRSRPNVISIRGGQPQGFQARARRLMKLSRSGRRNASEPDRRAISSS